MTLNNSLKRVLTSKTKGLFVSFNFRSGCGVSHWNVQFQVIWEFLAYWSGPKQFLKMERQEVEASTHPCAYLSLPLSHKRTWWYHGRLRFSFFLISSGYCLGSSSCLVLAKCGIWVCFSFFLTSQFFSDILSAPDSCLQARPVLLLQNTTRYLPSTSPLSENENEFMDLVDYLTNDRC